MRKCLDKFGRIFCVISQVDCTEIVRGRSSFHQQVHYNVYITLNFVLFKKFKFNAGNTFPPTDIRESRVLYIYFKLVVRRKWRSVDFTTTK
jgi:hypothetical protein